MIVSGRDEARGNGVVEEIRSGSGRAAFAQVNLDGSKARSDELAALAESFFGPVNVLVNNAGIVPPENTLATDEDTFDRVFAVHVKAPFFLTAAVIPGMRVAGGGAVINLGSWIARLAVPGAAVYSATNAALEGFTRTWAAEFGTQGIRVNTISPGVVQDDPQRLPAGASALTAATPAGRIGLSREVADAAVFLASDEASFMHGTVLDIDGGRSHVLAAS